MKILVVEDDPGLREMLEEMLSLHGHTVRSASNGEVGLRAVAESAPDLILCDIAMPVMDGYTMLERLRESPRGRTIPVIMLTAKIERQSIRQGMNLGADDYITKPFNEQELIQSIAARLEKKALIDELDAFAHTVAHGLKNPLTPILGSASLLASSWETLDPATRTEAIQDILENARRMRGLIDELMLLTNVRKSQFERLMLDMGQLVQEALARVEHLARERHAEITRPDSWPPAAGHGPWIIEVWTNYLSNAIRYGGRPPRIQIGGEAISATESRFFVQDQGPGLTPEQQQQLFLPFNRLGQTDTYGHGLGLSIVRMIVEKLHGSAGVESQPGAGCRFTFTLPTTPPEVPLD